MNSAVPCTHCKEQGHKASKCPTLHEPIKDGFYSGGGGGGGGHSHDEEEEHIAIEVVEVVEAVEAANV